MKLSNLKTKRIHKRTALNQRPGPMRERTKPMTEPHEIHTYSELQQQIHDDLRSQHPEWVLPNGDCPKCDAYEARLMGLLEASARKGPNEAIVVLHHALENGLN
jgi:hypothetical protein